MERSSSMELEDICNEKESADLPGAGRAAGAVLRIRPGRIRGRARLPAAHQGWQAARPLVWRMVPHAREASYGLLPL